MSKQESIQKIIANIGGKENIKNAWHCMTRLRFDLVDQTMVNWDEIKKITGVIGAQFQSDQCQIVVGTQVKVYFDILADEIGLQTPENDQAKQLSKESVKERKGIVSLFMDTVSGVFGPIVPAIAGAGMIKGLLAGLIALKVVPKTSDTVIIIDLIASGVFYFLPFFLAVSAAKIFKTNEYLAAAIAACLMYPTLIDAAKLLVTNPDAASFYYFLDMIPISIFNYAGSVIPIIFSVLALSYIYRFVDKIMPNVLKTVFTPTVTLFIAGLLALTVIGPIGIYLGKLLALFIRSLFDVSAVFAGAIVGAIRPVAILTGMHHAMTPIALQNFAELGYDMLMPMMFMANMAIAGATAAMYFKAKNKQEKTVIVSAAVSALLGITEPALFGVLTKYKKAFIAATAGSAIASAFIALFGVRLYGYILSSIFSLPAYIGPYFIFAILGVLISICSSFIMAYIFVGKKQA